MRFANKKLKTTKDSSTITYRFGTNQDFEIYFSCTTPVLCHTCMMYPFFARIDLKYVIMNKTTLYLLQGNSILQIFGTNLNF